MRKKILTTGSAMLALAASLMLAGCGSEGDSDQQGSDNGGSHTTSSENSGSENGNGESGNSGSENNNGGSRNNGGSVDVNTNGSLPDGWPSSAIVPEGDVSFSGKVDDGYSLIMLADKADVDAAIDQMKSSGYSETTNFMSDEGGIVALENSEWSIGLLVGKDDTSDKYSVIYTVTAK